MRLFQSTLAKLARRPATLVTFGLLAGLLVLILLAVTASGGRGGQGGPGNGPDFDPLILVTFPGAYLQLLSFVLGLGGLFALIYGAAVAGSEWSWGTFKASVARGESRSLYTLSTYTAMVVMAGLGLLVAFLIGIAAAIVGALIAGASLDGLTDTAALGELPWRMVRGGLVIATNAAIGFTVATLARSQLAGIGLGIGLYFVGTFASIFIADIVQYLPFQLATRVIGGGLNAGGGGAASSGLSVELALVLLAVWLVGAPIVAIGYTERAEVTG